MTHEPFLPSLPVAPQFQLETTADLALAPIGMTIRAKLVGRTDYILLNLTPERLWVQYGGDVEVRDSDIVLPAVITYDPRWK